MEHSTRKVMRSPLGSAVASEGDARLAFLAGLRVSSAERGAAVVLPLVAWLGAGAAISVEGGARRVEATAAARSAGRRFLKLLLQRTGHAVLSHSGRRAELGQGDLTLIDGAADFTLDMPARFAQTVVLVPRDLVARRHEDLLGRTGTLLHGDEPAHRLVFDAVGAIARHAEHITSAEGARSLGALVDLLGALGPSAPAAQGTVERRYRRALADIEAHLADPELCATMLAGWQGISRRRLDAIFRARGTSPERIIWDLRLSRVATDWVDPAQHDRRLLDIALSWGFTSEAHCSRAFSRKFGASPRAFRRAARAR